MNEMNQADKKNNENSEAKHNEMVIVLCASTNLYKTFFFCFVVLQLIFTTFISKVGYNFFMDLKK